MAIYMKFGSIDGQVTTDGFAKWIECHSFQMGVGRAVSSGAGGSAREGTNPSISDITITKSFDASSAKLYSDALAGHFDSKVEIKFTSTAKNKVETFLTYELTACGVSGYSVSSGGDNPTESISLNYTKIMLSPTPLDNASTAKGGDKVSYDLAKFVRS